MNLATFKLKVTQKLESQVIASTTIENAYITCYHKLRN